MSFLEIEPSMRVLADIRRNCDGTFAMQRKLALTEPFDLGHGVVVGPLAPGDSEGLLAACEPAGLELRPLDREVCALTCDSAATGCSSTGWRAEQRLQTVLGLLRLVRLSCWSYRYGAVARNGGFTATPTWAWNFSPDAFSPSGCANRSLKHEEATELRSLIAAYVARAEDLPSRVRTAMWRHEYACHEHYLDASWISICIALESLVNTKSLYGQRRRCFVVRVAKLAEEYAVPLDAETIDEVYGDVRSELVHGSGRPAEMRLTDTPQKARFQSMERLLAAIVRRCVLDASYAGRWQDDPEVDAYLPVDGNDTLPPKLERLRRACKEAGWTQGEIAKGCKDGRAPERLR